MIEALSSNHDEWLKIALHICKNPYLADDLVQEMYLRIHKYPPKKPITNGYIYVIIKNCFRDQCKAEQIYTQLNERTLQQPEDVTNNAYFSLLDRLDTEVNKLHWYNKELIIRTQSQSPRKIQAETGINYQHIYRNCSKTEDKLRERLEDDYNAYKKGLL
jgi:DNA-directed RNA polymerase specialized sigma24 family protein